MLGTNESEINDSWSEAVNRPGAPNVPERFPNHRLGLGGITASKTWTPCDLYQSGTESFEAESVD